METSKYERRGHKNRFCHILRLFWFSRVVTQTTVIIIHDHFTRPSSWAEMNTGLEINYSRVVFKKEKSGKRGKKVKLRWLFFLHSSLGEHTYNIMDTHRRKKGKQKSQPSFITMTRTMMGNFCSIHSTTIMILFQSVLSFFFAILRVKKVRRKNGAICSLRSQWSPKKSHHAWMYEREKKSNVSLLTLPWLLFGLRLHS